MGSAGVRRRQADVENMSAEISELRERRRQERLDIAERRRRVANLSRRSAQRRQEAQAADRRLQAQERRILEINDQMTGQVSEARLGSRTERSRTLIRRRQLDAQRLRTSGLYNTGELGRAAAALEGRYEALNREILDLERAETVLRDSTQGVIRNLQRRRAQASSPALQQEIQQELAIVRSDLTRQLNAFQSQRQQLATNYGGLNEERRSINRTGRGRSVTFRAAESLNARADLLRNLYGASGDQTRVTIGGQRMQISEATRRAIEQANAGNTEAAKEILGFTSRRLTALEREINNTNKLADAEQRRLQIVQKLEDRFQQLRTANASGGNFQEFERLLGQVRELSGSRNMPLFNRIAAQASAAAGRVAMPRGFMRGAASPVLGTPFMEGSPRWIEAQRRAEARATSEAEAAGRRADKELRAAQSGYPSSPILGTATMMGSPRWKAQQERVRKSAEAALKSQERAANAAQKAADRDLREAQRGYPSSPVTGTASMIGSPKWKTEQERVRRSAERALRAQERAASIAQREADKALRQAQSGYPSSPIRGTSAMSGSPRWVEAQERARLAAERRASAQARAEERVARKREAAIKKAERDADRALRESQKGYPSSPIMGTATMVDSPRWRANQDRLARAAARRAGTGGRITGPSSPIDAPQQLQSLVLRGERQQLNLLKLQQQGADVSSQLVNLENRLNSAKQAGYEISRANLKALESEVKASSDLASRETARIALARAATGGGGTARQTDTRSGLSQILANLQKASGEAIAFRGGRSGEQALSSIVEVFNASVGGKTTGTGAGGAAASAGAAGQNVVDTFASRLTAGASKAAATGMKFAGAGVDGIKKAFGIKSPARVMIEIVLNLVSTYIAELEKANPRIRAASDKAFGNLSPERSVRRLRATNRGFEFYQDKGAGYRQLPDRSGERSGMGSEFDEMMRRFRSQIASLTTQPRIYENLLNAIPNSGITTDLAGVASSNAMSREIPAFLENQRMLGPSELEKAISAAYAEYAKTVRIPNPWVGPVGDYEQFISRVITATQKLSSPALLPPAKTSGLLPAAGQTLGSTVEDRIARAYQRSEERSRAVLGVDQMRRGTALPPAKVLPQGISDFVKFSRRADEITAASLSSAEKDVSAGESKLRNAVSGFFSRLQDAARSALGGIAGGGGRGSGGGRPPVPPAAGGPDPEDFAGRVNEARGDAGKLLGLKDLADMSGASIKELQLLSQALSETREGVKMTDASFDQLTKVLSKVDDQIARRDPNADFLTRRFGQRGGQAVGEGLIGGAFPLLFGQGAGAAAGGGLGGFFGGMAGGTLGFGLSLAGTAIGSQVDLLMQATQDTGNMLRDLVGNFEQIKESGLLASRGQEKLISNLLEAGNKTAAYAIIQDELNRKLGVDGAAKLREAADAGDRLKRAMADLGVQLQIFIAGPLADFLNRISSMLERTNESSRFERAFGGASQEARQNAISKIFPNAPKEDKSLFGRIRSLFGYQQTPGTSNIPIQDLRGITADLEASRPQRQLKPQEQRDKAIRDAETRQAAAQRELEVFNKRNEGADILKGFKQQANAVRREQEDINRQSFELRRDYERQVEDIRRGVEDKISQLRQENAQKELEILVKQGQIREQQFKNAALAVRNELSGDDLAQNLADAVTTYLGAQLSAQDQIEQRRKQFEIEVANQQIELEKYKADVARNVAQLNLSTAEKIQEINRSVARRNEDAALNSFEAEKKIAKVKAEVIQNELLVMQARQRNFLEQARINADQNPGQQLYTDLLTANQTVFNNITENLRLAGENLKAIEATQAPPRLREVAAISAKSVSTAGVAQAVARGGQLQKTLLDLELALINSNEVGNFNEFIGRISDLAKGPFQELENSLTRSKKALGMAADDSSIAIAIIQNSYENLVGSLAKQPNIKMTPELLGLLSAAEKVTIEFEKLRPTIEFYTQSNDQLSNSITQARDDIASLLQPVGEYDKWLQIINSRGGLGINPEQEQQILKNAKALDNLNAKLKVLNGLRDIASGWTDSFIQLNKELLKGGNLLESVKRFAEGVADRTLDVILEFTLRPLQDKLFKNLTDILGIKPEQNPLLQPINAVKENTDKLLQAAIELVKRAQAAAPPAAAAAPANGIVPGPGGRQLPSEPPKGLQWYQGAQPSAAPTGQFTGIGGPDLPAQMGAGGGFQLSSQARALVAASQKLGVSPLDLATIIGFETGGTYSPSKWGGAGNSYMGLIQFGPEERRAYGAREGQSFEEQVQGPVVKFLQDRFRGVGMSTQGADLLTLYRTVLGGNPKADISKADAFGTTPASGVSRMAPHRQEALRRFFGGSEANIPAATQIAQAQSKPEFNADENARRMLEAFRAGREQVNAAYNSEIAASTQATESLNQLGQSAAQAADGLTDVGTQMSDSVTKFQKTVGTGLQAISSIAMGIGGAQMIRKGGAYNTLMGAASIFGSISSITGMFGKGGSLAGLFGGGKGIQKAAGTGIKAFASGGRPDPYDPAIIGENGPELWVPDRPGTIIPNDELYVPGLDDKGGSAPSIGRYARRAASSMESSDGESGDTIYTGNYGRAVPYQRSETTREIDRLERITTNPKELPPIKYETTRVNEYDFVTPEQLEASNARTAKIARNQTIRELADSMKTRKRLGL